MSALFIDRIILQDREAEMAHVKKSVFPLRKYLEPGKFVSFGRYRFTDLTDQIKDNTPLTWYVKDVLDDRVLLLSRYGLEAMPYHTEHEDVTWETCSLRTWLNGEFLNSAFNEEEQKVILTVEVDNSKDQLNPTWSWAEGSNNTFDRVFLLSHAEVKKYFPRYKERKCRPTRYSAHQGAYISPANGRSWWWLRTPGSLMTWADVVTGDGTGHFTDVDDDEILVRPALWIDLTAGLF